MARLAPLPIQDLTDHQEGLDLVQQVFGFVPNSMPTMARVPGVLPAFQALAGTIMMNPLITPQLTQMVALITSVASGCRYCQSHTGHSAERLGVDPAKLSDIWEFETSKHFDEAERAALRLAFHAGQVPNGATDADFENCRPFYSEDQIATIVSVCALFGYLNRWNDTVATELEDTPTAFGYRVLARNGWEPGKHAE